MKYAIQITWFDDSVSYAIGRSGVTTNDLSEATECNAMDARMSVVWWRCSTNRVKDVRIIESYHSLAGHINDMVTL